MSIFEQASRIKVRFDSGQGMLTVEDLWDLPLTHKTRVSLDGVAKKVNKDLKESQEESFVVSTSTTNKIHQLKMDIVKHVIGVRLEEAKEVEERQQKAIQKQKIMEVIQRKKDEDLESKSMEELEALLNQANYIK